MQKPKTINQAVLTRDKDQISIFLKCKINKGHFKSALISAIKTRQNDVFELLFNFNKEKNIVPISYFFDEVFRTSCFENNIYLLDFLDKNTQFKLELINCKEKKYDYIYYLINNTCSSNSLEALKWLLDKHFENIKCIVNRKDSSLAFKKMLKNNFLYASGVSKKSIVEFLYNFNFIQDDYSIHYQAINQSISYKKLNVCKFLFKHFEPSEEGYYIFLNESLSNNFYGFSKLLLKESKFNLDYLNIDNLLNSSILKGMNSLPNYNNVQREKFIDFVEYLVNGKYKLDIELLLNNSSCDYTVNRLNQLLIKQRVKDF